MSIAGICHKAPSAPTPYDIPDVLRDSGRPPLQGALFFSSSSAVSISSKDRVLVFDGRLDNRSNLGSSLGLPPDISLSDLLQHAWLRWTDNLPAHLTGDFALAAWDGPQRKLLLARDAAGARPLHFTVIPEGIAF